jgi:glycosyltransferase involved in cell wall biosynthesis
VTPASFRAEIAPVPEGIARPTWSVLIPTFNCAAFLEEALSSVLSQDPGPDRMEIIVVDDHSTKDDPYGVTERIGRGRVRFVGRDQNVGKVRNFETGLQLSSGHLVHQLHGDDRVGAGFYSAMESAFNAFPTAGAFFTESNYLDASGSMTGRTGRERQTTGVIDGWLERIVIAQRIQTPSIVLRREVYETLGGFDRRLDMFEDWEMWIRVANRFPVGFVTEATADYRTADGATTGRGLSSGEIFTQLRTMLTIVDEYLPADMVRQCRRARDKAVGQMLLQFIPALTHAGEFRLVSRVLAEALSYSPHPRIVYRAMRYAMQHERYRAGASNQQ